MTAAATGGAVSDVLNVLEGFQNVAEILVLIERVRDVSVAYLLAIAYHIIFYHNDNQTFLKIFYHPRTVETIFSTAWSRLLHS